jgi:hypothetical protein
MVSAARLTFFILMFLASGFIIFVVVMCRNTLAKLRNNSGTARVLAEKFSGTFLVDVYRRHRHQLHKKGKDTHVSEAELIRAYVRTIAREKGATRATLEANTLVYN